MVDDHSMVFPIMATAFIALAASKLVCRQPIYWSLAEEFLGESEQPAPPVMQVGAATDGKRAGKSKD
jgi:hypothetical protein